MFCGETTKWTKPVYSLTNWFSLWIVVPANLKGTTIPLNTVFKKQQKQLSGRSAPSCSDVSCLLFWSFWSLKELPNKAVKWGAAYLRLCATSTEETPIYHLAILENVPSDFLLGTHPGGQCLRSRVAEMGHLRRLLEKTVMVSSSRPTSKAQHWEVMGKGAPAWKEAHPAQGPCVLNVPLDLVSCLARLCSCHQKSPNPFGFWDTMVSFPASTTFLVPTWGSKGRPGLCMPLPEWPPEWVSDGRSRWHPILLLLNSNQWINVRQTIFFTAIELDEINNNHSKENNK